jgi:hypothetical protein
MPIKHSYFKLTSQAVGLEVWIKKDILQGVKVVLSK